MTLSSKICNNCKENKPIEDFYIVKKRQKSTVYHICKLCCSTKKKSDHYDYYRDYELRAKYGITIETYRLECEKRANKCDICTNQVGSLHVDHCHKTGKIRGYLCGSCNRGIGLLKESIEVLQNAIEYLGEDN